MTLKEFIRIQDYCSTCGKSGTLHEDGSYYLDPSHVKTRGAGGDDENNLIPQCRKCHTELHAIGIKRFEAKYGVGLTTIAKLYTKRWHAIIKTQNGPH